MIFQLRKLRVLAPPAALFCVGLAAGLCLFGRTVYEPPTLVDTRLGDPPKVVTDSDVRQGDEVRVYDVHDLLACPEKWSPVELSSDGSLRTAYPDLEPPQRLARLIRDYTNFPAWSILRKNVSQIDYFAATLVIRQTPANHQRVSALLEQLRAAANARSSN